MDIIGKLPKLPAPTIEAKGCDVVTAKWEPALAATGNKIVYQLYQGMFYHPRRLESQTSSSKFI